MKMPLEKARLCLECDTIHDQITCPQCGSAAFFYVGHWLPPHVVRGPAQPPEPAPRQPPELQLLPPKKKRRLLRKVLLAGVSVAAAYGLLFRPARKKTPKDQESEL